MKKKNDTKKNLLNSSKDIDDFFQAPPTANQKAWSLINDFYNLILNYMTNNNITQAELARRLGKSRSAISQMFNKTPNISIKRMVEIAENVGIGIEIKIKEITDYQSQEVAKDHVYSGTSSEEIPYRRDDNTHVCLRDNSYSKQKFR